MSASAEADGYFLEAVGTPEGRADPWSRYAALHHIGSPFASSIGSFVVFGYDDCHEVLRSDRFGKDDGRQHGRSQQESVDDGVVAGDDRRIRQQRSMLFLNPPDHTAASPAREQSVFPTTSRAARSADPAAVRRVV